MGNLHEKPVGTKGTGYERDLYTFSEATPLGPIADPYFIEDDFFRRIDNDGALALETLRGPGISGLSDAGRSAWAVFLNSLLERHPDHLNRMDERAKAVADRTFEHLQAGSSADDRDRFAELMTEGARAGMGRNFVRQHMMQRILDERALEPIRQGRWVVVNNLNPDFEFITTDAPVVINHGVRTSGLNTLAVALGPHKLFMIHPAEWGDDVEGREALGLLAFAHNLFLFETSCHFVYSRTKLGDSDVVKLRLAAETWLGRSELLRERLASAVTSPAAAENPTS